MFIVGPCCIANLPLSQRSLRLMKQMCLLALVSMAVMLRMCQARSDLHPVILVPGSGGNQLEARLTKAYKPSSLFCRRREDVWFRLWFDPTVVIAPLTKCFAERMKLHYDPELEDYRNTPGVETRVPYFGSAKGLSCLDPHLKHITAYMETLVESLEELGYVDGVNLFGAPYDFRYGLAAEGHPSKVGTQFLEDLKQLIEDASASNGKPVIILSHSLGGLFVLQLLNRNPPEWHEEYIKHFIALSAPWGGTVQEMLTFASGYTLGVPLVEPLLVRDEQRSSESNMWLLPAPNLFRRKPLVITPKQNYTALEMPQFLADIGFEEGVYPYKNRILPLVERLILPEVRITCVIGSGIETPETLFYREDGFDKQPEIVYGDGDGTVNMASLLAVESEWAEGNGHVKVTRIPHVSHTSILQDDVALREITQEISDINSLVLSSVA